MQLPNAIPIVIQYVDAAIAQLRRKNMMKMPGKIPKAMQDSSIPSLDDWKGWRPVPSTVTDQDLNDLEQEMGLKYPPSYRQFLKYLHFIELTENGVRFERHEVENWSIVLRKVYFNSWPCERVVDSGLIPFGSESFLDAGPVCFDRRGNTSQDGDCPVVFWDHEWVGSEREVGPMFSSCEKMFECLLMFTSTDIGFTYHDDDDDHSSLAQKQELMAQFLAIDPEGAGGPAKEYWTSHGVQPAD